MMKIKKLLSICALTLSIVSCTTIGASAAEVAGKQNKSQVIQDVIKGGLNGKGVFNNINITANTKVGEYLTDNFIDETNKFLAEKNLNTYWDDVDGKDLPWKIEKTNTLYDIQKNVLKTLKGLDASQKDAAVKSIKDYLLSKLTVFEDASKNSNGKLLEEINKYFRTSKYGTLSVGQNSDNAKTVTLMKSGKVVAQVNSNNIYKAVDKLNSINNYEDLKALILKYYPDADNYINSIK